MKTDFETSKCHARNAIAADLLAGKRVSGVRYNRYTGCMEQTYGTTDFRKRLSELRLDYEMPISWEWEENYGNNGKHKVHFMTEQDIKNWQIKYTNYVQQIKEETI